MINKYINPTNVINITINSKTIEVDNLVYLFDVTIGNERSNVRIYKRDMRAFPFYRRRILDNGAMVDIDLLPESDNDFIYYFDYPIIDCLLKADSKLLDSKGHDLEIIYDPDGGYKFKEVSK
jgi:hypothetical protein